MGRGDRTMGSLAERADEGDDESDDKGVAGPAFEPGQLVAKKYRLKERIGSGAMGEVWRARHEELNVDVALKFALASEDGRTAVRIYERFRFEAQVSAKLARLTRHIVAVHDAGRHDGVPYIAMELIEGVSLDEVLDSVGRLTLDHALTVLEQLTDALTAAHDEGVWHRDIKGGNVMVSITKDGWLVKLADFGISKQLRDDAGLDTPKTTSVGMLVGTPAFMSPEQLAGATPDAASDLWSLAVLMYEALAGTLPFAGKNYTELMSSITVSPPLPMTALVPDIPPGLDAWFARALAKKPADRFETPLDMLAEFRVALTAGPARSARRAGAWAAIAVAVVVAGGAAFFFAGQGDAADATPPHESEPPATVAPPAPAIETPTEVVDAPDPAPPAPVGASQAPPVRPAPASPPSPTPKEALVDDYPADDPPAVDPPTEVPPGVHPVPKPSAQTTSKPKPYDKSEEL